MLRRTFGRCFAAGAAGASGSAGASAGASGPADPFTVLGLSTSASRDEVKTRFRELAMQYHPDSGTNADARRMNDINRAYNVLIKEGMVDQIRRDAEKAAASASASAASGGGGGSGSPFVDDDIEDVDVADPVVTASLDPSTERISEDGKSFMYLNRQTGRWVRRTAPLTRPRQPRYTTFQQEKSEFDLSDEIRKKQMLKQQKSEEKTRMQRALDAQRDAFPFVNSGITVVIALAIYAWGAYHCVQRAMQKKWIFDDKREFFFDKREHRAAIDEAYDVFQAECDLAAAAAVLIFAAAATKTHDHEPEQPPTPNELGSRAPPYLYCIWNGA